MTDPVPLAPNHHADYPPFRGLGGLVAGLSMLVGTRALAGLAIELAGVTDVDRVIDVGCGPGTAARGAARRGAQVVGVDPAPLMLALARRATRRTGPVTWQQGTAESLPAPSGWATVVWSIATVHHWRCLGRGRAETRRVLAPNGRLLVIERRVRPDATGHASHGWTDAQAETFVHLCAQVGLVDARTTKHRCGRSSVLAVTTAANNTPHA